MKIMSTIDSTQVHKRWAVGRRTYRSTRQTGQTSVYMFVHFTDMQQPGCTLSSRHSIPMMAKK